MQGIEFCYKKVLPGVSGPGFLYIFRMAIRPLHFVSLTIVGAQPQRGR